MKVLYRCLFLFVIVLSCVYGRNAEAQDRHWRRLLPLADNDYVVKISRSDSVIAGTDLSDVAAGIFSKKKARKVKSDTITSKPVFSYIPAIGYTLETKLAVTLTGNVAFRTDSLAHISTITSNIGYSQNKQFTFPIQSEIWTPDNSFSLVGDYRFYKYPQSTFGLGSNSNIKNEDPMDYIYFRFQEMVLKNISGGLFAGVGYIIDYHNHITQKGNLNGNLPDYTTYGPESHSVSSGFSLQVLFDNRENSIYPDKGFYASMQYRDNIKTLGSTANWSSVIIDLRQYFKFPASTDNVLAIWSYDWLTLSGKPPYLDLPATGWDPYASTGRGYIQGRFRGAQEVYAEAEYRFNISHSGLFGGVVFGNAQSFSAAPGTQLQSVQPGYGLGVRIKLNKLSKTNVAIDYGFGRQGSGGLFINVGELF